MLKTSILNLSPVMGRMHNDRELIWVTVGGGGYLKTGYSSSKEEWHPRMLLSQLRALGINDVAKVGNSADQNNGTTPLLTTA